MQSAFEAIEGHHALEVSPRVVKVDLTDDRLILVMSALAKMFVGDLVKGGES
jgi:hypothetical protein